MKGTPARFPLPQPSDPGRRKPDWLRVRMPGGGEYERVRTLIERLKLNTVCAEARCPNIGECWGGGTATVMLMGEICTRGCRFCYVKVGHPAPLDPDEPEHLAAAVAELGLEYLVVTSVDRDDLPDGGARHFARAIRALRERSPKTRVEVLIPDFQGDRAALDVVADAGPHVIAHNVETVQRLQDTVRDRRASYRQSLDVLAHYKKAWKGIYTKSSIMLGLGETDAELLQTFRDLRGIGVEVLTLGQYLQPSPFHLPVLEFVAPEKFEALRSEAIGMGFLYVAAGPLVRSSYRAAEFFLKGLMERRERGALVEEAAP
jgi:lipoic acid synthetase